ncbi:MAG TPA: protein kinase [Pirellulaceae bacterium]|nr:protein kinase [Pirellulaceae bacterium]
MSAGQLPSTDKTESDLSGRKLGDYQILRRIGRGGMAEVYLAEQGSLQRQVAFKVLRPSLAGEDSYVRRFRNEALAAAKLSHANIVQIYEVGCCEGVHFIAQEYIKGQNLKQLLTRQSSINSRLAISIMRQVAAALHRAGQLGVIHRDIKPENIMLSPTGEVKVADFGLARVLQNGEAMNLTQVGITMGTPLYMSPEQVEGKPVDQRSDLYSFGVTCYHMLAGKPPFEGETPLSIAVQHLKTAPEKLEELRPDMPAGLCRMVHKLMAKKPENRYASAADLLREMRTLQLPGDDDEPWPAEALAWIDHELATASGPGNAATQQLQALMQSTAHGVKKSHSLTRWWPLLVGLAFMLGGFGAWSTRPKSLLAVDPNFKPQITKLASAREQFILAAMPKHPSEAAYRAVWEYFPPEQTPDNLRYSRLAKHGLAKFYRDQGHPEKAEPLYRELAAVEKEEVQFRIWGHLGLANLANSKGDEEAAILELSKAAALIQEIPTDRRRELLQALDEPLRDQWQQAVRSTL